MKPLLISTITLAITLQVSAQTDSVSLGTGYQNEVWYDLSSGNSTTNAVTDWDLAFDLSPVGVAIRINPGSGTRIWAYPGDTSDFSSLDTTGMSAWTELHNSETTWHTGALNALENGLDVGWGDYNMSTHIISGNRIFLIQMSNGAYQKLIIESLISGVYHFRHASLDNTMDMRHQLDKSQFGGEFFAYYNLKTHSSASLEPNASDWDIYFGKYTADLGIPYNVTGALINPDIKAVKVYPVNDPTNYTDWGMWSFGTEMNTIGYDWKSFNMQQGGYDVADSTVYFVKDTDGDIYKVVFTGFDGSATGNIYFNKTLVSSIGLDEEEAEFMEVYPNPASDFVSVVLSSDQNAQVEIIDLNGRVIHSESIQNSGLEAHSINLQSVKSGLYILKVSTGNTIHAQRLLKK